MLLTRGDPTRRSQAAGLLDSARRVYQELGMNAHAERVAALTQAVDATA
jgi:hypothetical protein